VKRKEPPGQRLATALITIVVLVIGLASPVGAEPTPAPTAPPNEGATPTLATLRANLEAAAAGYIEAQAKVDASKAKQAELEQVLKQAEAEMARVRSGVAHYAAEAYKTGRMGVISTMLQAHSPDEFLDRAATLDKMTQRDQRSLAALVEAKRRADEARAGIEKTIAEQTAALQDMERRKAAAEKALAAVSGRSGGSSSGGSSSSRVNPSAAPDANPVKRNPDGSLPAETCSVDDPTTSGCITPRTLHNLNEAKRVGFNWYVSCYRPGSSGEHPKGRACDFAAYPGGFVNASAGGSNRDYGDRLAAFYIKNAKALAVMYVVWYCQIWQVGIGWRRYNSTGSNCGDAPANDHTNHVHVSIY
jgi:peptidoglycan DL-endopeptidase CwlO